MKIFILFIIILVSSLSSAQDLKIMTYNIRYDVESDVDNSWSTRKDKIVDIIRFYEPEVFGIQEGLPHQVHFLDSIFISYKAIGNGRDGNQKGEHCSIFYNVNQFKLIKSDTFWLSETPEEVSKGWDAALNRICTYGLFKNKKTKEYFWVFNTHFDHMGVVANNNSAKLIHDMILKLNVKKYPVIIIGDFNLEPSSEPILFLSRMYSNTKEVAQFSYNAGGTFNAFDFFNPKNKEIDFVFVSKDRFLIKKYAVLRDSFLFKYPSDHFPVMTELEFLK